MTANACRRAGRLGPTTAVYAASKPRKPELQECRVSPSPSNESPLPTAAAPQDTACLPALISIPRAAKLLGLSRASAYRYAASGDLPVQRFGGRVYVVTAKIRHLFD